MKRLLTSLFFLGLTISLFGQNCDRWYLGGNALYLIPLKEMQENSHLDIRAVSFNLMYNLTPKKESHHLHFGGQMAGGISRSMKDKIILDNPVDASAKSKVRNGMINITTVGRIILQPNNNWSPYFEGNVGLYAGGANQLIRLDQFHPDYDRRNIEELTGKASLSFGAGAGVLFKINEDADFDVRLSYRQAKATRFVQTDTYEMNENVLSYEVAETPAHLVGIHVGFRSKILCGYSSNDDSRTRSDRRRSKKKKKPVMKKVPSRNKS